MFERAFTELLAVEGHRILHGPVHHPFEHGKDIVTFGPTGELCGFQLKGEEIGLTQLDRMQGQLLALAGSAVTYPGVEPPRRPDRVLLVTPQRFTAPARDRLRSFNDANRSLGLPVIEAIEQEQLVSRFVAAHGRFLPVDLESLDALLGLLVSDGSGPFPRLKFRGFLERTLSTLGENASNADISRALSSISLLGSYVAGPWQRLGNHVGVAEAWLVVIFEILRQATARGVEETAWHRTYELCRDALRAELRLLLLEASGRDDLVIPDLGEGLVYGARATLVLGYCSAFYLAEQQLGDAGEFDEPLRQLLNRELPYAKVAGEAAAPSLFLTATALHVLGEYVRSGGTVFQWAFELASTNGKRKQSHAGTAAVADPYHPIDECLLRSLGADSENALESFDGHAYTLHIAVEWLARRGLRGVVERLWPQLTHLILCEFRPAPVSEVCASEASDGELMHWPAPLTGSWAAITRDATLVGELDLPVVLWRHVECLPFLGLVYPYRFTSSVAKAIDYVWFPGLCEVSFDRSALSTPSRWQPENDSAEERPEIS